MEALYKNTHPDYTTYLYLMAPISLAILNPISFVLMEIEMRRRPPTMNLNINESESSSEDSNGNSAKEQLRMVASVARNIFFNPIIAMTVLGILGNVIFEHQIPKFLDGILDVICSIVLVIVY